MQPPGCNLRSYGQKEHPENTFQAMVSVDTIGGQGLSSIFAEVDSVPTSQVLAHCVNVQIIYMYIIYLCATPEVYKFIVDIWEFSGSDKITKAAYMYA